MSSISSPVVVEPVLLAPVVELEAVELDIDAVAVEECDASVVDLMFFLACVMRDCVMRMYNEGRISVTIRPTKLKISTGLFRLVKMTMKMQ
jgi:hypothetical protein